jgi:hypothetical protein
MSKTYKIKVNQGADSAKFVDIPQVGTSGKALTVKAVPGGKYQLMDASTGFAPENIRATRLGKDLQVFFEGRGQADLVIEDYYEVTPEGFNGLIGEAESGRFYEYIPESAVGNTAVPLLADGSTQVGMALGGAEINASGAAVGALVAAAGLNPLLLAPLALLGAAAGGSSGASTSATPDTTPPVIKSAKLHVDDDTGAKDNVTSDKTPRISGETEANADVSVEVNGKTYTGKADANGVFVIQVPDADALADALYTPKVTATDAAKNKSAVFDGTPFKVDSSSGGGGGSTDNTPPIIKSAKLHVDDDTGAKDNVTSDKTPRITGETEANADVSVEVNGKTYTGKADANGVFVIQVSDVDALADALYTPKVTATDAAKNKSVVFDGTPFKVDTSSNKNEPDTDPNTSAVIDIVSITVDSGQNKTDFYTNDNQLLFNGTLNNFTQNGDWVKLELKDANDKVIDTGYVKPVSNGTGWDWSWDRTAKEKLADGQYSLSAVVVDGADNLVGIGNSRVSDVQAVTIDTDKDNNFGPNKAEDPNKSSTVDILTLSQDTGYSSTDFITKDRTHIYTGKLSAFTNNGASVELTLKDAAGKVIATEHVTPKEVSGVWTWSWDQTANALLDGKYSLQASLVDKAGNPIQVDTQAIFVDNSAGENGGMIDPNASLKLLPITFADDTGSSQSDYSTNDQFLTFKGGFDKNFVNNGDRVLVQVFGADGKVLSSQYVLPSGKTWEFVNLTQLGADKQSTTYTVKAVLVDAAGNALQATDQSFVIDRSVSIYDFSGAKQETGLWTYSTIKFSSDEQGSYKYTGSGVKTYTGGLFNLEDLEGKTFEKGAFSLEFTDIAGNVFKITNTDMRMDFTKAKMASPDETTPAVLPAPGFGSSQLIGSIGKLTLDTTSPKELDMASLYDGISDLGDVAAINHVDLSKGDHTLQLTMGDVLDLGVKNSFSNATAHQGRLQMRIDGDAGDKVVLDDLVGSIDHDWYSNNSGVTLDGQEYRVFTHEGLGLSLFVQQNVQINLV